MRWHGVVRRKQAHIERIGDHDDPLDRDSALTRDRACHIVRGCGQRIGMADAVLLHRHNRRHIIRCLIGRGIVAQNKRGRVAADDHRRAPAPALVGEAFGVDLGELDYVDRITRV